jgi:hypothetical protein
MVDEVTPKKKGKKLKPWQIGVVSVMGVGVAYLGYRMYENRSAASSSAGATPTTDTSGSSDDGSGGSTTDPLQGVDPNSTTGATYASELDGVASDQQTQAATDAGLTSELDSIIADIQGQTPTPTGSTTDTSSLAAWKAAALKTLEKNGQSTADANKAITEYLGGKSVTAPLQTASLLSNIVHNSPPPTTNAPPHVIVAKGKTPAADEAALKTTETNLAKDKQLAAKPGATAAQKAAVGALTQREQTLRKA